MDSQFTNGKNQIASKQQEKIIHLPNNYQELWVVWDYI